MKQFSKFFCAFSLLMMLSGIFAYAQNSTVSGKVADENGAPIIGVSVMLSNNQTVGTLTDIDGNYSIAVPSNSVLVFSCIGYKTEEVQVQGRARVDVTLKEDAEFLEETVVIGYGVQKKSDVTGSVASVRAAELSNRSTTDAAAALQGKASGVQIINSSGAPGSQAKIRVRGYSSNSGNLGPLLIVDGLKVDNISYLDPSMIESMEILKDAASAAIYGAQAGNGVVLITTKTGAQNNGTSSITYDVKITRQSLGKRAELFDAASWIAYKEASGFDMESTLKQNNYDGTDTDWFDVVFAPSFSQQHSFTFQGGNNKGHFFASINYANNDGIVRGDKDVYKRLSAQLNADYKLYDWITVGTNTSIERYHTKSVSQQGRYGNLMNGVMTIDPLTPVYYSDPSQFATTMLAAYNEGKNILKDPTNGLYYATSKYIDDDNGNPLLQRDKTDSYNQGINLRGTLYANITPFKGLTFTSRFGYRVGQSNSHSYSTPYYANKQTYSEEYSISASANNNWYYQWENFANYNVTLKKHNISAMAGMSYVENNSDNVSASASGPDILTGYEKNFQYLNYVNTASDTKRSFSNAPSRSANISYYGRIAYNYDNRYNFQANFRADAFDSSKLSKQSRWGYFPSFSAGWTLSNEKFFKNNVNRDIVNQIKLRASWGRNGNINVLNGYQYAATIDYNSKLYQYGITDGTVSYGSAPSGLSNPNLKWETSDQIDLGLDARFLRNRLTLGIDWYDKKTKDLLVSIAPIPEIGVNSTYVNAGSVLNRGLEIELGWRDSIGDLSYSISGNFSTLKNEVTYLDPAIYRLENGSQFYNNRARTAFEVGYPIWYMRGYKLEGIDQETGKPIFYDANGDGNIEDGDRTFIGKGIPDYTFGLTVSLEWKGFDFNLYGAGVGGNQIMNLYYQADGPMRNSLRYFYDNAWTETNKTAKVPSCISVVNDWTYWSSSGVIFDGGYFKIKQIQLGYTLPEKLLKKIFIKGVRAYVSFDDFFCFTKNYPGFDPETATTGSANGMGLDLGSYPTTRKIVAGINIKF
ncbi:MAG: TonB-dependent receptor [Bacteroidales bacterium]|nr:TonB-dependent receptor [Bacteroidales bacterium]